MAFTVSLLEIAVFLIALAFFLLVIYSIPVLLQLRQTARALEEFSLEGRKALEGLNDILKKTGDRAEDFGEVVKRFKETGLKLIGLVDLVVGHLRSPLITLLSLLIGIEYGIKRFRGKGGVEDDDKG